MRATFSTRGAVVKKWVLKHYLEANGQPIDIIPAQPADVAAKPFAISAPSDDALTARLQQALYKPSADRLQLGGAPGSITFEFKDANGLAVSKTFTFQPDGKPYVLRVAINASLSGTPFKPTIHGGTGIGDLERSAKPTSMFAFTSYQLPQAIWSWAATFSACRSRASARSRFTKDSSTTSASTITTSSAHCCRPMA